MTKQVLQQALRRAYQLGQDYWAQADSESYRENRKSDETRRKFETLVEETCEALAQQVEQQLFVTGCSCKQDECCDECSPDIFDTAPAAQPKVATEGGNHLPPTPAAQHGGLQ